MKTLIAALTFIALAACATAQPSQPTTLKTDLKAVVNDVTGNTPAAPSDPNFTAACLSPTGNPLADFQRCLVFVQADVQVALDDATAAKDDIGVQCHTAGLALLAVLNASQPKVVGLVSGAEALRVTSRSAIGNLPLWYNVKDRCAAVYNVGQIFRPLTAGLGVALP
jgi:hypothetical protein